MLPGLICNGDKKPDLVLAGEWMPITVFENSGAKLTDATTKYFDKKYAGWWNCLQVSDINHDGHPDIIAGNVGLNTQCKASDAEPAEMFYKDFDDNGSVDPMLCFYIQHKSYPFVSRDELLDQMSVMRGRFPDYKSYADATMDKIFTAEEMKDVKKLTANELATACFISNAQGKLKQAVLPFYRPSIRRFLPLLHLIMITMAKMIFCFAATSTRPESVLVNMMLITVYCLRAMARVITNT
ncbi:FG-GAP repeat domain-containing protein [Mucilaginibacter sp. UC70_90]